MPLRKVHYESTVPTVLDRTVQLAIAQPLSALFDSHFSPFSYGFRPGRSAHDALLQAAQFIEGGLTWVLHLDLDKFFDRAAHDLVLARLSEQVNSARLLELVRRFLTAPFALGKRMLPRFCGLPQGGPLSPLLANLLLDGLDRRISGAGLAFCRYADDICLFCVSAARAREAYSTIAPWIEVDLKLVINREKTQIVRAWDDEFLGHEMRCRRGRIAFRPSAAARLRLRGAVGRLLARHRIHNPGELIGAALMPLVKGWLLYFRLCDDPRLVAAIDRWTIKTVRQWLFQRAHDPRRRARLLIKRGVDRDLAWQLVSKSTPETEAADCPAVQRAFPVVWLRGHGWNGCCETPAASAASRPEEFRSSPDSVRLSADLDCCIRSCGLYERPLRSPMES